MKPENRAALLVLLQNIHVLVILEQKSLDDAPPNLSQVKSSSMLNNLARQASLSADCSTEQRGKQQGIFSHVDTRRLFPQLKFGMFQGNIR